MNFRHPYSNSIGFFWTGKETKHVKHVQSSCQLFSFANHHHYEKNRVWIFVRRSQRIRNSKRYFWTPSSKETKFQSYANARELTAHVGDLFDLLALINNFHMEGVLTKILAVEEILNFMISSHMFNFQSKHLQLF